MNKSFIGIVIIVLIIGGLWYYSSTKSSIDATNTPQTASSTSPSETAGTVQTIPTKTGSPVKPASTNTFKSIFAESGSHVCKISQVTTSGQNNNIIYIADGKMRAEFHTVGGPSDIMVYNGGYLYTWKEGTTVGTKTTIRTVADLPAAIPRDLTSGAAIGTAMNSVGWDCHEWIKDSKMLVVPSYVKF